MLAFKSFGELVMRHRGKRIVVMGGGPNLADDVAKIERADVWISANEHGAKVRPVDYVVAMDNTHTAKRVPMLGHIRAHTDAPIIGPWHWCDYGLGWFPEAPALIMSGVVASWCAYAMGAHPVILAGFDCYGGKREVVNQHRLYEKHIGGMVRVVSGPLTAIYPEYRSSERRGTYEPPSGFAELQNYEHGVTVEVMKPVEIRGSVWPKGTRMVLPRQEVWRQIKHRSLMEVA